jgi:hypothetical protein
MHDASGLLNGKTTGLLTFEDKMETEKFNITTTNLAMFTVSTRSRCK